MRSTSVDSGVTATLTGTRGLTVPAAICWAARREHRALRYRVAAVERSR